MNFVILLQLVFYLCPFFDIYNVTDGPIIKFGHSYQLRKYKKMRSRETNFIQTAQLLRSICVMERTTKAGEWTQHDVQFWSVGVADKPSEIVGREKTK